MTDNYGYTEEGLKHYTCHRAAGPIAVDGKLDEPSWQIAPRSPRFEDLAEPGRPALFDTRAAMLWDDTFLYVGFWLEEPDIRATITERDALICLENDVEVFIAAKDAYFEFELNALGTIMERFWIWQDTYIEAGFADIPEFDLIENKKVDTLGGPGSGHRHPRGRRWCIGDWDMPGLQWGVHLDGTMSWESLWEWAIDDCWRGFNLIAPFEHGDEIFDRWICYAIEAPPEVGIYDF